MTTDITAKMEALLDEAAAPDSKEQILKDFLKHAAAEVAFAKKVQEEGAKTVTLLRTFERAVEGGLFKFAEDSMKRGSELMRLLDQYADLRERAERLSPDDLGDLENAILWGSASHSLEDMLYRDRIQKLKRALEDLTEAFGEFTADQHSQVSKMIDTTNRKVKEAQDMLREKP
jgi:hypothetical protein